MQRRDAERRVLPCCCHPVQHAHGLSRQGRPDVYPSSLKSSKWWKYIFLFLFDTALVNTMICMNESTNHTITTRKGKVVKRSQLQFHEKLAQPLITTHRGTNQVRLRSLSWSRFKGRIISIIWRRQRTCGSKGAITQL